jgi:hypothetical protein
MVSTSEQLKHLPIQDKILAVLMDLSKGKILSLSIEHITVAAFKRFPADFCLGDHPEYPDSMKVSKRLYSTLKPAGLVRSANGKFELTPLGIDTAKKLGSSDARKSNKLPRGITREIHRILNCEAFVLFQSGNKTKILDSDLYEYLGASVRTPHNELNGRIHSVSEALKQFNKSNLKTAPLAASLRALHEFLLNKFSNVIAEHKNI